MPRTARPRRARRRGTGSPGAAATATAYEHLHALIVGGTLAPGSPLVERDLCARLGVSRTPVRAALLRLQQEGVVALTPGAPRSGGGRLVVAPLTAADLREIFLMAGALEATAVRALAERPREERDAVIGDLNQENRALRAAVQCRPPELIRAEACHRRFHAACIRTVAGPRLRRELTVLAPQIERYQRVYGAAVIYAIDEFGRAHDAIVEALRAGDAEAAERAVAADWRVAAERFGEMAAMLGDRGNW